ncbi:MAG: alpha-amylase [Bacteroidales bacterium]|nr:alpha-amylase [Bacteroidales bacterium]
MSKFALYQVLVRSFGNKITNPKPNGTLVENGCGKFNDFTSEALYQIKNLGVTHIWYTGILRHATSTSYPGIPNTNPSIVKGKAGSPYAISDYYDVHPDLAEKVTERMLEFEQLLERTHKTGLKVLIDFVPNHLSRAYKSIMKPGDIEDFGEKDQTDLNFHPQNNFYYLPQESLHLPFLTDYIETPAKVSGNDVFNAYPQIHDWYETIKLNYGIDYQNGKSKHFYPIPKTWKMMRDVLYYWAKKGIDGFRCDMAEMVPVEFWAWVIPEIKKSNPDLIFIAEIYNQDAYQDYLNTGQFDYLYDKVGLYDSVRSLIEENQAAEKISSVWQSMDGYNHKMLRFLENHDEQRIGSLFFAGNPLKALPGFFLSATIHQNPFLLYFGQEFGEKAEGESGFSGDDGRTSLFDYWPVPSIQAWLYKAKYNLKKLSAESQVLYTHHQKIIKFSLQEKAISEGEFYDLMWANKNNPEFNQKAIFTYLRTWQKEHFLCICNFSSEKQSVKIKIPTHAFEFCSIKNANLLNFEFKSYFDTNQLNYNGLDIITKGIFIELPSFSYMAYKF